MAETTPSTIPETATISDLIEKFALAEACWYSSVRQGNRTHLAPIWHVWHEPSQSVYIVTKPKSVRAQNLRFNDSVSLSLPDPMNVVIIEGTAKFADDAVSLIQPLFKTKYNWDIISDTDYQTIIQVIPSKLLAWGNHGEGRWKFDPQRSNWEPIV